ncbi:MAG: PTS sugar transporter subunit IIA [candidate division WOR-3 bacterium]|nr:PTS sugar transporter subunit IIA [candidate division WOR-3 bacterium]MCR4423288.1 PTS sugar transporter subunit IIA [candidate division WOR-3 bacterium]MDH7518627.1 PTS sugar transporter subunit IIA [bacterium]
MNLTSLLRVERINLDLKSRKKQDVLRELVTMIREGETAEMLYQTLLKREELGSTGIGKGIAIPHGRSLILDKLEIAVGRSTKGVDFDAIDNKPVFLFFLVMAPPQDPGNQYLITLGRIAMVAQELTKRKQLFGPQTPQEFLELVRTIEEKVR